MHTFQRACVDDFGGVNVLGLQVSALPPCAWWPPRAGQRSISEPMLFSLYGPCFPLRVGEGANSLVDE